MRTKKSVNRILENFRGGPDSLTLLKINKNLSILSEAHSDASALSRVEGCGFCGENRALRLRNAGCAAQFGL